MPEDSLSITENEDGTFTLEWNKKDPKWSFLNGLTSEQVQVMLEQAIKDHLEGLETKND
jgi:hypothetical protein